MLIGSIPGSIGETSALMCLIGALILITGVASWKIIVSVFAGAYFMGYIFNLIGANEFMLIPPHYHFVMGGLAFGLFLWLLTLYQQHRQRQVNGFMVL